MANSSPPRSRPASAASNRSRSSHRLSARSRRSHSLSPTARSTSRGRKSQNNQQGSPTSSRTSSPHAPAIQSNPPKRDPFPQPFFGLQQERPVHVGNYDFEQKYPEDVRYCEQGPNARVYRVYEDEAEIFDADMVGEARDSLDVLLVFAGLFSAVLTTFVAQTSQSLSTDFAAVSTSVLIEITLILRSQTNGSSLDSIPTAILTSSPSGLDVWVNGLWFVSLTLSLGAALLAVLIKQWLRQYMSMISGTVRDRSHIRQYRYDGLQKWHVLTFVAVMPFILHVAVGLFLIGLVLYLIPLRPVIAGLVGFITSVVYGTYIVTNVLPLLRTQCPYRTPFSDVLNIIRHALHSLFTKSPTPFVSLREAERITVTAEANVEDAGVGAMEWLMAITSNPPTKRIVLQSLGAFSPAMTSRLHTSFEISDDMVFEELASIGDSTYALLPGSEGKIERLLRSQLHVPSSVIRDASFVSGVTDPDVWAVMVVSKFMPAESQSALGGSADDACGILRFLERGISRWHRPFGCPRQTESPPILPRMVWDALVQAAINTSRFRDKSKMPFNPEITFRLCEMVCSTYSTPPPKAVESLNLLPMPYALDGLVPFALSSGGKYPTEHRLAVMLAISDYLSNTLDILDGPYWGYYMLQSTWTSIFRIRDRMDDMDHCLLLRKKVEELLQGTSILNPSRWEVMEIEIRDPRARHKFRLRVAQCWYYALSVYYHLSVSHATSLHQPFSLPSTTLCSMNRLYAMFHLYISDIPIILEKLWIFAFSCNDGDAFDAVLLDDILDDDLPWCEWDTPIRRVVGFISGIARQHNSARYIQYLMEEEHLFNACWMLAEAEVLNFYGQRHSGFDSLEHAVVGLIELDPQNSSWENIRACLGNYLLAYPPERYTKEDRPTPPPARYLPYKSEAEYENSCVQCLRNVERVYKTTETYFSSKHVDVLSTSPHRPFLQRLKMGFNIISNRTAGDKDDTGQV